MSGWPITAKTGFTGYRTGNGGPYQLVWLLLRRLRTTLLPKKDLFPQVHDLVDEIRALLQGVGEEAEKDMLLEKLYLLHKKYPTLHSSPFQPSIDQLIAAECKTHCELGLEEHDLDSLWLT